MQVEELESRALPSAGGIVGSLHVLQAKLGAHPTKPHHGSPSPNIEVGSTITPTTTGTQAEEHVAISPINSNFLIEVISDFSLRGGFNTTKYAVSTDNGTTWTEGFVPLSGGMPATSDNQTWQANSDPVVAIDRLGNAYVADLYFNTGSNKANGVYVSVGTVTSSGVTFTQNATNAVLTHLSTSSTVSEDKEWIAVDNTVGLATSGNVYVTWTHFVGNTAAAIYFSQSTDHGQTWSAPVQISTAAQSGNVQGSQVAVGPDGTIYVAYEVQSFSQGAIKGQIFLAKSTNGGTSFTTPVSITGTASFFDLQSNGFPTTYRTNSFPSLAVGPEGNVYLVYGDNTKKGTGGNARVQFVESTDGGTTFTGPVTINNTSLGQTLMPSVAVDPATGWVWASWFNTQQGNSNLYDIYAAISTNLAASFSAGVRLTSADFIYNAGGGSFIGDYAGIAAAGGYAHPVWTAGSIDGTPANGALQTATLSGLSLPSSGFPFTLGTGTSYGKAVVTDSTGNVYVTGSFQGTVDFDPSAATHTLTSQAGSYDIYVAKYSSAGAWLWAADLGGSSYDVGQAISVDGSGNVYVTGDFEGSATFGPFLLTGPGSDDAFVAKLNASGVVQWAKNVSGAGSSSFGLGLKVDSSGNVYTTGSFTGTANFGSPVNSNGSADAFAWKLDTSGNSVWAIGLGGIGYDTGYGLGLDSSGNPYVVGSFSNLVNFGATPLTSTGLSDIFVTKLSASTGSVTWATQMGGSDYDEGYAIALDSSNNVFVTGYFNQTATFGGFSLTSTGGDDAFVAKLSNTGTVTWVRGLGGSGYDNAYALAVDSSGNVYVTGSFYHQLRLNIPGASSPYTLTGTPTANAYDMFFARFNSNGDLAWARDLGGSDSWNAGFGVWVDSSAATYLTGQFSGTVNFDPGPVGKNLTSPAGTSFFLSKINIG